MRLIKRLRPRSPGQALVEFALVFPLFLMILFALIVFGLYVFLNQQLSNAAREAARYAAVHSVTSQCPTVSRLDPILTLRPADGSYYRCDAPEGGWPNMTAAARSKIWGMAPSAVQIAACWSGYVDPSGNYDALPAPPNTFTQCTMRPSGGGSPINPETDPTQLPCPVTTTGSSTNPPTADGDDKASSLAVVGGSTGGDAHYPTTVTVYTCFQWRPPMSGVGFKVPIVDWTIGMPTQITLRAVITEALQRQ
jgi:hypothetical protein